MRSPIAAKPAACGRLAARLDVPIVADQTLFGEYQVLSSRDRKKLLLPFPAVMAGVG